MTIISQTVVIFHLGSERKELPQVFVILRRYVSKGVHHFMSMLCRPHNFFSQGRRKLIFTGPVELVGLGWGFEKQVLR